MSTACCGRSWVAACSAGDQPGEGTDDSDMTAAVLDAYLEPNGFSLEGVAERFLAWLDGGPKDVGGTTGSALTHLRANGDPTASGKAVWHEWAAGNGSLMRCLPTGLIRTDPEQRRKEAAEISAITHSDPRCIDACVAYCDLIALLLDGVEATRAVEQVGAMLGFTLRCRLPSRGPGWHARRAEPEHVCDRQPACRGLRARTAGQL